MSVMEKNQCPYCASEDTKEKMISAKFIPKEVKRRLYAWTEYVCNKCGTEYIDGKLVIVEGAVKEA